MENLTTWLLTQSVGVIILGVACFVLWRRNEKLTTIIIQMTKDTTDSANNVAHKLEDTIDFLKSQSK